MGRFCLDRKHWASVVYLKKVRPSLFNISQDAAGVLVRSNEGVRILEDGKWTEGIESPKSNWALPDTYTICRLRSCWVKTSQPVSVMAMVSLIPTPNLPGTRNIIGR